jgi:hypothetical protein
MLWIWNLWQGGHNFKSYYKLVGHNHVGVNFEHKGVNLVFAMYVAQ